MSETATYTREEIVTPELAAVHQQLRAQSFALTSDEALGFPGLHQHIDATYFTHDTLGPEVPGVTPPDRLRAREAVQYWRNDQHNTLVFAPHHATAMRAIDQATQPRLYNRVHTTLDPAFNSWTAAMLSLVPPEERQQHGTFGMNFLRTCGQVVEGFHQDDENYVIIYVTDKVGEGAQTSLHPPEAPESKTIFAATLQPGQLLIFKDSQFKHNVTPLVPSPGAYRDAIVALVHYDHSYPVLELLAA